MPDQLTSAFLIVVAIAYLGGAVLLVVALAKVLLAWSVSWRRGSQPCAVALGDFSNAAANTSGSSRADRWPLQRLAADVVVRSAAAWVDPDFFAA
ncbi:hypothetical protein [Nocardioides psychrotolerans]|uniref:hypothetical protein n=1 Tax=Nocardioides psychrotolerans TaxID=1005945 RepID=UPI003137C37D